MQDLRPTAKGMSKQDSTLLPNSIPPGDLQAWVVTESSGFQANTPFQLKPNTPSRAKTAYYTSTRR